MQWAGFGRGFVYEGSTLCTNVWTDAARKASAEARRMSKAAHRSTVLATGKMAPTKVYTSQTRMSSKSALEGAQMAAEAERVGYNIPVSKIHSIAADSHDRAAEHHEEAMQAGLEGDKVAAHKEAAMAHRRAAESHRAAAKTHSED